MEQHGVNNDERYESASAHVTFCRLTRNLTAPAKLMNLLEAFRHYDLGKETIREIELVEHDWYNSYSNKRLLHVFRLGGKSSKK